MKNGTMKKKRNKAKKEEKEKKLMSDKGLVSTMVVKSVDRNGFSAFICIFDCIFGHCLCVPHLPASQV